MFSYYQDNKIDELEDAEGEFEKLLQELKDLHVSDTKTLLESTNLNREIKEQRKRVEQLRGK